MIIGKYILELNYEKMPLMACEREYECNATELNSTANIVDVLETCFRLKHKLEEHVVVISVNKRLQPLAVFEVAHGGSSHCQHSPKELFTRALLSRAEAIIVAHNHPNGNTTPSPSDIQTCKRMEQAAEMLGIEIYDFIIVGDDTYSFRESGELNNEL